MGTRLKEPLTTKVDLVGAGANQRAHILLFKNKSGGPEDLKGGDKAIETQGILGFIKAIAKRLGWTDDQVDEIAKEATTFSDNLVDRRYDRIDSELWDFTWAFREALMDTLKDDTVDRAQMIQGSMDQFVATIQTALPTWLRGDLVFKAGKKIASDRLARLKAAHTALGLIIEEAEPKTGGDDGVSKENKIDKSKLPEDVQKYIEKLEADVAKAEELGAEVDTMKKQLEELGKGDPGKKEEDDVLKSLDPNVQEFVKGLQSRMEKAEARALDAEKLAKKEKDERLEREYTEKAKAFTHLSIEDPEKYGKMLKVLHETDPAQYDELMKSLEAANEAVKESAVFKEIGSGTLGTTGGSAWAKIDKAATDLMAQNPNMTKAQAIDNVTKINPGLAAEYRNEMEGR